MNLFRTTQHCQFFFLGKKYGFLGYMLSLSFQIWWLIVKPICSVTYIVPVESHWLVKSLVNETLNIIIVDALKNCIYMNLEYFVLKKFKNRREWDFLFSYLYANIIICYHVFTVFEWQFDMSLFEFHYLKSPTFIVLHWVLESWQVKLWPGNYQNYWMK